MALVLKRPAAEGDLDDIWWYIAQDSPQNADRFLDRIEERCCVLAEFPNIGTSRDDLRPGLRSHPVGKYLIFYFPLDDGIDIARVLRGSRDVESLL